VVERRKARAAVASVNRELALLRRAFKLGYWTGCRFGEISQLEWSQVDFDGRAVRLRNDQTKAREPRVIPLGGPGNDLHDMLLEQQKRRNALCPDSRWVFFRQGSINPNKESARRGRQVQDIRKAWAAAVKETEINRLFHDLRRTGVRNLVRAGVPEKVAMLNGDEKK
jgi:integrase